MSVITFPVYDYTDPRCDIMMYVMADRLGREVYFDGDRRLIRLERKDGPVKYASRANVIRFPVERTRAYGGL